MSFPLFSGAAIKEAQAITGALIETDMAIRQDFVLLFCIVLCFPLHTGNDCLPTNAPSHEPSKGHDY